MTLKASFASVLRALRTKRNISQRDFADTTSRTYLSKLELGKSSITLDKLDQISRRLDLSPLTLLTLTLSEKCHKSVSDLLKQVQSDLVNLQENGGLSSVHAFVPDSEFTSKTISQRGTSIAARKRPSDLEAMQTELCFSD